MNRNQVNDPREEADGEAGQTAGNTTANVDAAKNVATRKDNDPSRSRFGRLKDYIVRTM